MLQWDDLENPMLPHSWVIAFTNLDSWPPVQRGDSDTLSAFYGWGGKKKKTTDNCGNLIATKATQGSFWCNLIQQEPVTFRNHCQLVRRFKFFPANQWLCHSQHGKQFSSNVRMMSSDASIEQLPKKPQINPSGANQLFTLKLGLQYFTCTVHTFTDSVYIF